MKYKLHQVISGVDNHTNCMFKGEIRSIRHTIHEPNDTFKEGSKNTEYMIKVVVGIMNHYVLKLKRKLKII